VDFRLVLPNTLIGATKLNLRHRVDFDQPDTSAPILASDNRSIITSCQPGQDGGIEIIWGLETGAFHGTLLGILPVIVRRDYVCVAVVECYHRVG